MIDEIKEFVRINKVAVAGLAIILCIFLITKFSGILGCGKTSKAKVDLSLDSTEIDVLIKEIHDMQQL